jgi:membrane-associated phospholipid phosphatase
VCLSTLFTGQHYILDVVTGLMLGFTGYYAGFWLVDKWDRDPVRADPVEEAEIKTASTD